jgi:hypothetical protein
MLGSARADASTPSARASRVTEGEVPARSAVRLDPPDSQPAKVTDTKKRRGNPTDPMPEVPLAPHEALAFT